MVSLIVRMLFTITMETSHPIRLPIKGHMVMLYRVEAEADWS